MNNTTAADAGNTLRQKAILVVDDDDAVRRGLRGVLVSVGYEVVTASNGVQALAAFRRHPCDLALVDMNMPLLPGWGSDRGAAQVKRTTTHHHHRPSRSKEHRGCGGGGTHGKTTQSATPS